MYRNLELTHQEVEIIENALLLIHDKKIEIAKNNNLLDIESKNRLTESANQHYNLFINIQNGNKDVEPNS